MTRVPIFQNLYFMVVLRIFFPALLYSINFWWKNIFIGILKNNKPSLLSLENCIMSYKTLEIKSSVASTMFKYSLSWEVSPSLFMNKYFQLKKAEEIEQKYLKARLKLLRCTFY